MSEKTIESWAAFLEEEGLITIEYKFTNVYLVKKKTSFKELEKKSKTVAVEKTTFEEQSHSMIGYLDKLEEQIKNLSELINKTDIQKIASGEVKELKELEAEKYKIDKQLIDMSQELLEKLQNIDEHLSQEKEEVQKTYEETLTQLIDVGKILSIEEEQFNIIKQNEKSFDKKVAIIGELIDEKISKLEGQKSGLSQEFRAKIKNAVERYKSLKKELHEDKRRLSQLLKEGKKSRQKIEKLHKEIAKKIKERSEQFKTKTPDEIKKILKQRTHIGEALSKLYGNEQLLRTKFTNLIEKRRSMETGKSGRLEKEIETLNKDLRTLAERRGFFEKTIKGLLERLK